MTTEELIRMLSTPTLSAEGKKISGELKDIEFKGELPDKASKYVKTIVAYANTQGGKLVVGVADGTMEIVGVPKERLFRDMDAIASAISDSSSPQIIPDIEPYTIGGQSVIIVSVSPGQQRPYYIKFKGKENGTYIRVGATTRLADPEKIKELEMEGARISWDEQTCIGYTVKEAAIKKLCRDMNSRRKEMQKQQESAEKLPVVTRTNLENWNIIRKTSDGYLASNAFALLTSDYFPFAKIQCAVFKGTDRAVFLDKREYSGSLYEQIDEAVNFVLRNIRLGAAIEGIQRKESYELPIGAIREMIINAQCHRRMTDESCVQVALYDDRLEVTSPGGLYNGLTVKEALHGRSRLRNRAIANIFNQIGLIEAWGTGFQRIRNLASEYGLPEPEFIEMPESFRVNLYRSASTVGIGKTSAKHRQNIGKESVESAKIGNATQQKILKLLAEYPNMTGAELAEKIGISKRNIEVNIRKLKDAGALIRHGASKGGYWEVIH